MKKTICALALLAGLSTAALAQAPAVPVPAAPAATPYSVATTTIGEMLDKPALKLIFVKYLPDIAANPQIEQGRALTLPDIVQYVPDQVTPDKLAAIDVELKALPPQ
jgi:para-nitrobenzyl esterase